MRTLDGFANIRDEMYWKGSALAQIEEFKSLHQSR